MNTSARKQIERLYDEEVERWHAAWDDFYRQWSRIRGTDAEITDEEFDGFEARDRLVCRRYERLDKAIENDLSA